MICQSYVYLLMSLSLFVPASSYNRYKSTFYLVFDFCEHDLAGLLCNANVKFSLGEIKKVMQQLLSGLYFIHFNKVRYSEIRLFMSNLFYLETGYVGSFRAQVT